MCRRRGEPTNADSNSRHENADSNSRDETNEDVIELQRRNRFGDLESGCPSLEVERSALDMENSNHGHTK